MNAEPSQEGSTAADWLVVLLLSAAAVFAFIDRFALSLMLEPIKHDLQLTDGQLGLLNGIAFGLFYAGLGLPLGWIADRWSRKGTIVIGMTVWSAATAACGYANSFGQLMIARIGVGAGEAGLVPASYAIIHDRFAGGRVNLATSVFQMGGFLGIGLSMLTAGFVYAFFMGGGGAHLPFIGDLRPWQQTFVAAALPAPIFIVALLFLKERRAPAALSISDPGEGGDSRWPIGFRSIYALLFIGTASEIGCGYALLNWLPSIFAREAGWTPQQIGVAYGVTLLVVAPAGVLAGGWLTDKLQRRGRADARMLVPPVSSAIALGLLLLLPVVAPGMQMLALAACLHFVLGMPMGVVPALIQAITPGARRSLVSAIYVLSCNVIGIGIGSVVIGNLADYTSDQPHALRMAMFYTMMVAIIVAVVLLTTLRRILLTDGTAGIDPRFRSQNSTSVFSVKSVPRPRS